MTKGAKVDPELSESLRMIWQNTSVRYAGRLLLLLLLATAFIFPVFTAPPTFFGGWDQGYFHGFDETARKALLEYGQFPLWSPYHCGGYSLAGHVANLHLHPFFWLLALPLGTAIAYKIYLLIHVFVGMWGMDVYLRERGADRVAAILGVVGFGACGYFSWHFAGGHLSYYGLTLIPWVLICLDRARVKMRYGVWIGVILALVFLMGGAYSYPFMVLLVAVHAVVYSIRDRSVRIWGATVLAGVISLGLAGVKTGPVFDFTLHHPRPSAILESIVPVELLEMLLSRDHSYGRWKWHPFTWPEYGAYVGYIVLILAGVAVISQFRKRGYYLGMLVLFAALVLGKHTDYSPYALLRQLPFYDNLRLSSRYVIFVVFYVAALAAFGLTELRQRLNKWRPTWQLSRWLRALPLVIVAVGVAEVLSFGVVEFKRTYNVRPIKARTGGAYYQSTARRPQTESYLGPFQNRGIVNCYEEGARPLSKHLRLGKYIAQIYPVDQNAGAAHQTFWSPNEIRFRAKLKRETVVVINQNYDHNWRAAGFAVVAHRGLLGIRMPPGDHRATLEFRPFSFTVGLLASVVTGLGIFLGLLALKRRDAAPWREILFPRKT